MVTRGLQYLTTCPSCLEDRRRWRELRRQGLRVAERFGEGPAADALESALEWVLAEP